jgi:hypothetical protein
VLAASREQMSAMRRKVIVMMVAVVISSATFWFVEQRSTPDRCQPRDIDCMNRLVKDRKPPTSNTPRLLWLQ